MALVAHRIQHLHGSMHAHTKQRQLSDDEVQQQLHDDVQQSSQHYVFMLHTLMVMIGENLLVSDDNKQHGALNSWDLVDSTAQLRQENTMYIWLEDVRSERSYPCAAKVSEVPMTPCVRLASCSLC